ncbi:hypothetical protein FB556_0714 [Enteractinococcus coprophilus]|uniref:Uncharacterized protein n=1 Tax=Enteractinococcus coprophilus TaxID=1027633 RepID=A0A543ANX7_9MICC|nr:hypothetical protein FB556_0714 [Enteractinococcus coprophilus]
MLVSNTIRKLCKLHVKMVVEVRDRDIDFQHYGPLNMPGKALYSTDLLKAHQLRKINQTSTSREEIL